MDVICMPSRQLSTLAKQSRKSEFFDIQQAFKISSLAQISSASLPACQPAVRPGSARCRPPDFSQVMYSCAPFTNFLIR